MAKPTKGKDPKASFGSPAKAQADKGKKPSKLAPATAAKKKER